MAGELHAAIRLGELIPVREPCGGCGRKLLPGIDRISGVCLHCGWDGCCFCTDSFYPNSPREEGRHA